MAKEYPKPDGWDEERFARHLDAIDQGLALGAGQQDDDADEED